MDWKQSTAARADAKQAKVKAEVARKADRNARSKRAKERKKAKLKRFADTEFCDDDAAPEPTKAAEARKAAGGQSPQAHASCTAMADRHDADEVEDTAKGEYVEAKPAKEQHITKDETTKAQSTSSTELQTCLTNARLISRTFWFMAMDSSKETTATTTATSATTTATASGGNKNPQWKRAKAKKSSKIAKFL